MQLHRLLSATLGENPDRVVLDHGGRAWSAAELDRRVRGVAAALAAEGLEPGDRVAVLCPNLPETVIVLLACFSAGFVAVPLDFLQSTAHLSHALDRSAAALLVAHASRVRDLDARGSRQVLVVGADAGDTSHPTFAALDAPADEFRPDIEPDPSAPAAIVFTSGTTTRPKGVLLRRSALEEGLRKYLAQVPLGSGDATIVAGQATRPLALRCQILPLLARGGCICLLERFSVAGFVAAFRRPPTKTCLVLTPSMMAALVRDPDFAACDFSGLRLCISGGDRVPPAVQARFESLTGVAVTEQCGMSECGPYAMNPPFGRKKPGSIGLPAYGTQVCLVDDRGADVPAGHVGEIVVAGPALMDGYWDDTALSRRTLRGQKLFTGDLARFDEDGYLWFAGRRSEVIVREGYKVPPVEVENALLRHPAVAEACVFGVPRAGAGQMIHASLVPRPGQAVDGADLTRFLHGVLAAWMVPEEFEVCDQLPLTGMGKVDRDLVRMRRIARPLIEQVPFFGTASAAFIRDVVPHLQAVELPGGECVFREGDAGDAMYFLTRGEVVIERRGVPGRVAELREGAFFGEVAILRDVPRTATVRAVTDCEVYCLTRDRVAALTAAHPEFRSHLEAAAATYRR